MSNIDETAAVEAAEKNPITDSVPAAGVIPTLVGGGTEPPGSRTPQYLSRAGYRQKPRPQEPLVYFAELVRGVSWTFSYADGPIVFPKGGKVAISESEKIRLEKEAVDRITFGEPFSGRVQRTVAKFVFYDFVTRKKLAPRTYEDVQIDAAPVSDPFAVAQRDRDAEDFASAD